MSERRHRTLWGFRESGFLLTQRHHPASRETIQPFSHCVSFPGRSENSRAPPPGHSAATSRGAGRLVQQGKWDRQVPAVNWALYWAAPQGEGWSRCAPLSLDKRDPGVDASTIPCLQIRAPAPLLGAPPAQNALSSLVDSQAPPGV